MKNLEIITSAILANCETASTKECAFLIDIAENIIPTAFNVVVSNAGAIVYTDTKTVMQAAMQSTLFMFSGVSNQFHTETRQINDVMSVDLYFIDLTTGKYYNLTIRESEV